MLFITITFPILELTVLDAVKNWGTAFRFGHVSVGNVTVERYTGPGILTNVFPINLNAPAFFPFPNGTVSRFRVTF